MITGIPLVLYWVAWLAASAIFLVMRKQQDAYPCDDNLFSERNVWDCIVGSPLVAALIFLLLASAGMPVLGA